MGEGGKGISQAGICIAVEVRLAPEASPSGEDGEGQDLAGTERRIRSGVLLCLRAGLAEVVDHDVEYGEEGVHIDHEDGSFPFGNGTGKPTLVGGHLPLKFQWITHTKRLRTDKSYTALWRSRCLSLKEWSKASGRTLVRSTYIGRETRDAHLYETDLGLVYGQGGGLSV